MCFGLDIIEKLPPKAVLDLSASRAVLGGVYFPSYILEFLPSARPVIAGVRADRFSILFGLILQDYSGSSISSSSVVISSRHMICFTTRRSFFVDSSSFFSYFFRVLTSDTTTSNKFGAI